MGVPGLWDFLRPAARSHSLFRLTVDSFGKKNGDYRCLRVGVDASIWLIHSQTAPGGLNPCLRTLFFKLCNLLSLPILPLFVFDGPKRPKFKRGKQVRGATPRYFKDFIKLINAFGFEHHVAPGEAEAELAYLSKINVVDVILSDDVDSLLFGGLKILRNWSIGLSGNSKSHSDLNYFNNSGDDTLSADDNRIETYTIDDIKHHEDIGISPEGLILVALLAGGDYHPAGVTSCGIKNAVALARAGFGDTLIEGVKTLPKTALNVFLENWRESLKEELRNNNKGYLSSKRPSVANSITASFPDLEILERYINPIISSSNECEQNRLSLMNIKYDKQFNVSLLARFCEEYFEWGEKTRIMNKFRNSCWNGVFIRDLMDVVKSKDENLFNSEIESKVKEKFITIHQTRNKSRVNDYIEYRISIDPSDYVNEVEDSVTGDMKALREARRRNDPALKDLKNSLPDEERQQEQQLSMSESVIEDESSNSNVNKKKVDHYSLLRIWVPSKILKGALPCETESFDKGLMRKESTLNRRGKGYVRTSRTVIREDTINEKETEINESNSISLPVRSNNTLRRDKTIEDFIDFTDTSIVNNTSEIGRGKGKGGNRGLNKGTNKRRDQSAGRNVRNQGTRIERTNDNSTVTVESEDTNIATSDKSNKRRSSFGFNETDILNVTPKKLDEVNKRYALSPTSSMSPPSPSALIKNTNNIKNDIISIDDEVNLSPIRSQSPISISSGNSTPVKLTNKKSPENRNKGNKYKILPITSTFNAMKPRKIANSKNKSNHNNNNKNNDNTTNTNNTNISNNDIIDLT